jgi:hypothetical protein
MLIKMKIIIVLIMIAKQKNYIMSSIMNVQVKIYIIINKLALNQIMFTIKINKNKNQNHHKINKKLLNQILKKFHCIYQEVN